MATTIAALEARLRGLESRMDRAEEDATAVTDTVVDTLDHVRDLKGAVGALEAKADHLTALVTALALKSGVEIPPLPAVEYSVEIPEQSDDPKSGT